MGARRACPPATGRSSSTTARPTAPPRSPPRSVPSSCREPRRGFGAACFAGLGAARSRRRLLHGLRRLARPRATCRGSPTRCADGDGRPRARRAGSPSRGAWPVHARIGQPRAGARACGRRSGVPLTDLGPMRAARREPLLDLGIRDRRFGWPLEMVLAARRPRAGGSSEVPVPYRARAGRAKVTGTVRGTRAGDARHGAGRCDCALIVIAKEPAARTARRRGCCPPCSSARGGPRSPRRRWPTRSRSVAGDAGRDRSSCSTARPARGCRRRARCGSRSAAAGSTSGSRRAFDDVGGPALLVGMDTPQVTPALLAASCVRLGDRGRRRGARPRRRTAAGGRSACASRPASSSACR